MISTHAALSTWEISIFRVYINEFCFAFNTGSLKLGAGSRNGCRVWGWGGEGGGLNDEGTKYVG